VLSIHAWWNSKRRTTQRDEVPVEIAGFIGVFREPRLTLPAATRGVLHSCGGVRWRPQRCRSPARPEGYWRSRLAYRHRQICL